MYSDTYYAMDGANAAVTVVSSIIFLQLLRSWLYGNFIRRPGSLDGDVLSQSIT